MSVTIMKADNSRRKCLRSRLLWLLLFIVNDQETALAFRCPAFVVSRQPERPSDRKYHHRQNVIALAAAKGAGSKKKKKSKKKSGGFGGASPKKQPSGPPLSAQAQALLDKHGQDVDAASSDYFRQVMSAEEEDEEATASSGSDPADQLFGKRIAATWDTVALFLPLDYERNKGKVDDYVARRMRLVAHAASGGRTATAAQPSTWSLLDVGCGDGAILPYLLEAVGEETSLQYLGMDLSKEMIALARDQYPDQSFSVGRFPHDTPPDQCFDCILFNGSLQFFKDTRQTLMEAMKRLKQRSSSSPSPRILLSHVQGARFVQNECRTNPGIAVRYMPTLSQLQDMLKEMGSDGGWRVVTKEELFSSTTEAGGAQLTVDPTDMDNDMFYLVGVERQNG